MLFFLLQYIVIVMLVYFCMSWSGIKLDVKGLSTIIDNEKHKCEMV